jgi:hypothetical protein
MIRKRTPCRRRAQSESNTRIRFVVENGRGYVARLRGLLARGLPLHPVARTLHESGSQRLLSSFAVAARPNPSYHKW